MALHVALTHRTAYAYDRPVTLGPQTIRLRPAPHSRTPILSYALRIEPAGHFVNWQQDPQSNFQARVVFPDPVTSFTVTVDLVADMATVNPFDFFLDPAAEAFPFSYDPVLDEELAPFRKPIGGGVEFRRLIEVLPRQGDSTVNLLVEINRVVQARTAYIVRMETGVWEPEQTLVEGRGSCRDSAWLLVALLRELGFAARFVSGYLIQLVADVAPLEGPAGPSADFTDLHAWAEVYLPGAGWIGFDATSGLMTGEGHIPLAATPNPASAAPISGGVSFSNSTFDVAMTVNRVRETPRSTRPYDDAQWAAILAAGDAVDAALAAGDVRLTMGGEPTFVAADDPDALEWTGDAMGPTKRRFGGTLVRRLGALWSPGAALSYATGKQYPGEALPRWALHQHWRADGEPVFSDASLFADPDVDHGQADAALAHRFARALAQRLHVDPGAAMLAYEDAAYYEYRETRLPQNVEPTESKVADQREQARLRRVFIDGLDAPVGTVLPLRRFRRMWQAGRWSFREGKLYLIPGDSPLGLRLPLAALPWVDPDEIEPVFDPDPFAPRDPFTRDRQALEPAATSDDVRTALTVQPRVGLLYIFLPPTFEAEDWIALLAAIEATAQELGTPIVLEGYGPPDDPRLRSFSVTPDPGVLEVNLPPAEDWRTIVGRTERLYAEARTVGLIAETFMIDGRHVGTGGGNHVVMGAATAEDSPFLRRPDLLRSLVGFWHNHPSLSFAFSGLFIGPTSQHPRVDEARQDSLADLDIAFGAIQSNEPVPPWETDRLFRNILADMTGSMHRTEFSIDKLYDPSGPGGRRGLIEFRAFEMPPDARMSVAQALLMRTAVAAFWGHPYSRKLIRWGTRLHDDFLLPYFAEQDFGDALDDLAQIGQRLDPAWFAPHFAFRFPIIGETRVRDMGLELRHALEPWHVLSEDSSPAGTTRYVDSSAERVQVRLDGWQPERFALACNGVAVPLTPTERAGEFVGGVRFKAWAPPSALHPSVPAQGPLVFDVYDAWNGRSLGGMTHRVVHPGGRGYDTRPVNAPEAEARRKSRFSPIGHTPGPMPEPRGMALAERGAELPRTLDLRRFAK